MARAARDELTDVAADAAIDQACRILRLPAIRDRHGEVAAAAARQQAGYQGFLAELLSLECDDRESRRKARLVREAGFPRPKRIEDFDYAANPNVPAALIHTLAKGAWVAAGQPCWPSRQQLSCRTAGSSGGWTGCRPSAAYYLEELAAIARQQDNAQRAVRLLTAARSLLESRGSGWLHAYVPRAPNDDNVLDTLRSAMVNAAFDEAWAWGQSSGDRRALEFALEKPTPLPPSPQGLPRASDVGAHG